MLVLLCSGWKVKKAAEEEEEAKKVRRAGCCLQTFTDQSSSEFHMRGESSSRRLKATDSSCDGRAA